MTLGSGEWRIEHPLSGPKWALFARIILALAVIDLGFRDWDYTADDGALARLIWSVAWVVLLLATVRGNQGWVVRADGDALHIPRGFRIRRHIRWSDIKEIRPDAPAHGERASLWCCKTTRRFKRVFHQIMRDSPGSGSGSRPSATSSRHRTSNG